MRGNSPALLGYVRALYGVGVLGGLHDGQLLERFIATGRDRDRADSELAFAALVERHGLMIWRVCRSLACNLDDAEDAFQATFLILVRKARSLQIRQTLGPWLYAVAVRTGLSARNAVARRRAIERATAMRAAGSVQSGSQVRTCEADELGQLLHLEIMRLPERFRAAVVLCDLEGMSYSEAAKRLNLPLGTVQSRLARARRRLRDKLKEQAGLADGSARLDSAGRSKPGFACRVGPPAAIVGKTCRSAKLWAAGAARLDTIVSSDVLWLIEPGARSMLVYQLKFAPLILMAATILSGVALLSSQTSARPRQDEPRPSPQSSVAASQSPRNPLSSQATSLVMPAPEELRVAAGRGTALLFALDPDGNRVPDPPDGDRQPLDRRRRLRRRSPGGAALPGGMMHSPRKPGRRDVAESPGKEETREIRWAVVTGIVNHRATEASLSNDGKIAPPLAEEIYRRVELERQRQQGVGAWSAWQRVDPQPSLRILDNLPEVDYERTPEELRINALVDPLPRLTDGSWSGVDIERFVPKVREDKAATPIGALGGNGQTVKRPEPVLLMLRTFDFTVESGQTYRYRSRLVFFNMRLSGSLAPKRGLAEFNGPWSEPTNTVTVP